MSPSPYILNQQLEHLNNELRALHVSNCTATTRLQSLSRGQRNRRRVNKIRAATRIQSVSRGKRNRRRVAASGKHVNFAKKLHGNAYNRVVHFVNRESMDALSRTSKGHLNQTEHAREQSKRRAELERQISNNEMSKNAVMKLQTARDLGGYEVNWLLTSTYVPIDLDESPHLDITHISSVMWMNQGIRSLYIAGASINKKRDAEFFTEALKRQTNLGSLYFERVLFSRGCLKLISDSLKQITSLNTLSFEQISFISSQNSAEFVPIIAKCLQNIHITKLCINTTCSEEMHDVNPIGVALHQNNSLTHLELSSNSITSEGVKEIARALETNRALTFLNLHDNHISRSGAIALAEGIRSNKNSVLEYLNLSENYIPEHLLDTLNDIRGGLYVYKKFQQSPL